MTFNELILTLKARYKVVLGVFLTLVLLTAVINFTAAKKFESTVTMLVNTKGIDPVTGRATPATLVPGYMATQIDIISSRNVALRVIDDLKVAKSPLMIEQFQEVAEGKGDIRVWLANKFLANLDVRPSKKSNVIEIAFVGTDPNFVAIVANAFAKAYIDVSLEFKIDPSKKAASFLSEQTNELKKNLDKAQSNLSRYQQENGITSLGGTLDIELSKLNELSSQLVLAQSQLYDSKSRNRSKNLNSPDIATSPLVQSLTMEVSRAEAKLTELSARYGVNHPAYISARAELSKQKNLLNKEISKASGNVNETQNIYQRRVNDLTQALAAQKEKVLNLNLAHNDLVVLQREVENAEKAMDSVSQRFTETMQEGSSNQTDISILNPAIPPMFPSSPRIFLNIFIASLLGMLLGISAGLISEAIDQRVRSKNDISKILDVPVFAIISNKQNNDKHLTALPKRLLK